jgi:hypothetical protein
MVYALTLKWDVQVVKVGQEGIVILEVWRLYGKWEKAYGKVLNLSSLTQNSREALKWTQCTRLKEMKKDLNSFYMESWNDRV